MGTLFGIVAPVFALIAMGAAAPRLKLLDAGAVKGMSDFVFYLAMPSLLAQAASPSLGALLMEHGGADATLWVLAVGAALTILASLPLLAFRTPA